MSDYFFVLAAIVIGAPIALVIAHAAASRLARLLGHSTVAPQTVAALTALAGNIPLAWITWMSVLRYLKGGVIETVCGFGYVLLAYNACCFCYLNFLNVTETSLHANILMRLFIGNGLALEELTRIYGVADMTSARIHRMIALGQLREAGGRYYSNNKSLILVGRVINLWRTILGLPLTPQ
jgi:hypothetical protein